MGVAESPAITRAKSIQSRVNEVSEELSQQVPSDYCDLLEEFVFDCLSLASQWRALAKHFSRRLSHNDEIDLRTAGDILKPVAALTQTLYVSAETRLASSPCGVSSSDRIDLDLAKREIASITSWMASWPTWDSSKRDAARREYAEGRVCTEEQLMALAAKH